VICLAFWENITTHRGVRECIKEFCSLCCISIVHLHGLLLILVGLLKQLVIDIFSSQHSVMTCSNSPSLSSDSICVRSQIGGVATTHRTWAGRGTGESVGRLFFLLFFHSATHVLLSIQSLNQDRESSVRIESSSTVRMHTMRGWACWSVSLVLCITALCLHTVHAADPVTLHRVVSSELGCASSAGLEDVTSEAQCQLFAADVQCPGNEGNETATYGGPGESYLPIGCVCNQKSVYYISRSRSQHSQQIRVDSCSRLYPCVFQFIPALGVNCTQGTFSNTTSNQAIRCTVNSTTCTPLPSTTPTVVVPSSSSRRNFYKGVIPPPFLALMMA